MTQKCRVLFEWHLTILCVDAENSKSVLNDFCSCSPRIFQKNPRIVFSVFLFSYIVGLYWEVIDIKTFLSAINVCCFPLTTISEWKSNGPKKNKGPFSQAALAQPMMS